jgi:hypothetical protein
MFSNLKEKIVEILKKDEEDKSDNTEQQYSFHNTIQYRMLCLVIGFVFFICLLTAFYPSLLTKPMITIPQNGEITLTAFFPIIILFSAFYYGCSVSGSFVVDRCLVILNDIKNKVEIPQIISHSLVLILVISFVAYKIIFPTVLVDAIR